MNKHTRRDFIKKAGIVALLLFIATIIILIPQADRHGSASAGNDAPQGAGTEALLESSLTVRVDEAMDAYADDASEVWTPPAVFSVAGSPSPQIPFPRGENGSRRYHEVVRRDLAPELALQRPTILAKSPQDDRLKLLPEEIDDHTLVARRLVFDPASLDQVLKGKASRVLAPTPSDEVLTLEFDTIKTRSANTHTLQGHVYGEKTSSAAQIVYHDGIIHGNVMRYATGQELEYRILADGHMMVREIDHSTMTDNCGTCSGDIMASIVEEDATVDEGEYVIRSSAEEPVARDTSGWRTLDVVVGYGQEARIADGGYAQIEARIIDAVDRVTGAFANSGIQDAELMLLGTIEDPDYLFSDTSDRNMGREISALRTTGGSDGGALDTVTDFSDQLGADLVSFTILQGRGGQAGVQSNDKYTVVGRTHMTPGRMVFAHEIGHCLGTGHAWGDTTNAVDSARYAWRFTAPDDGQNYRTITSYNNGIGGSIIPYFSNPNISYKGAPTGAPDGHNVQNDTTADPLFYEENGIRGFDGSNPALGAHNAGIIDIGNPADSQSGLAYNMAHGTRTSFSVISPAAGAQWEQGFTQIIQFNGGDMQDLATIELYKNGTLHSTLATGVNPATHRNFQWTVPYTMVDDSDYMIRVEMLSNGSTLTADSGIFSIYSDLPHVDAQTPLASPEEVPGPISEVALTFNLPMNPATFSIGSDILSFTDPTGASLAATVTGATWSDENTVLTISFNEVVERGPYQMVIGPQIEDTVGNPMDQDLDGTSGEPVADRYTMNFTVDDPPAYYASMDSDPGWSFSHSSWAYGQPTGGGGTSSKLDPSSGFDGTSVIGYRLDGDYEPSINPTRWATTPAINCTFYDNVTLSFRRWLGVEKSSFDHAYIEVSADGVNWTTVWENPDTDVYDGEWTLVSYDISAIADGQANVYIRWGMGITDNAIQFCGWNIDEVIVGGDIVSNNLGLSAFVGAGPLYAGFSYTIEWFSDIGGDVKIELLKNGLVDSVITSATADDGSHPWQIPSDQTLGSDYRIRITSLDDASMTSASPVNFTIDAPTAIPYSENFGSGIGNWRQESSDDIDWTRQTGATGSSGTGPTDGQGGEGDDYLYTEASGSGIGFPDKLAQLSCWFDLRAVTQPEFSFHYHMYGVAMGTLMVEASTDGEVWDTLFTESGDKGNSWIPATVSLNPYAGQYVKIKISGTTGSDFTSDIAVDTFAITGQVGMLYSEWIASQSVGDQTGASDDFDGDGVPNAIENYFGTNPSESSPSLSVIPITTGGSNEFEFSHPVSSSPASDLTASYRWSKDLVTFHGNGESDADGTIVTFVADIPADGEVAVTATMSGTASKQLFVVVQVSLE